RSHGARCAHRRGRRACGALLGRSVAPLPARRDHRAGWGGPVRIHSFVPTWEPGAVGSHVLAAREVLRDAGIDGDVYAGVIRDGMRYAARPIEEHAKRAREGDVLCYSHAIGSTVADYVRARPEPLVVDYHNVTPREFFDAWDRPIADALDWGRRQLRELAGCSTLGLAVSRYNE